MKIYVKYDLEDKFTDVIYVPDIPYIDIKLKQDEFLKWMFNKNNNHEYWKEVNGEKIYCEYDVSAFVKWLNEVVYNNITDKAKVVNLKSLESDLETIVLLF